MKVLGSPQPYTPRPVFQNGRHDPGILSLVLPSREGFLRDSCLWGRAILSLPGFRLFSPPARGAFQLSLTVLVRYRSWDVFRVGRRCLPASRAISDARYSGTPQNPGRLRLRDFHPLWCAIPGDFGFPAWVLYGGPATPHPLGVNHPGFSLPSAAFGRPYSRHPCWFLFLRVLRCFNSPRSRSLRSAPKWGRKSHSGIPGSTDACSSPRLIAACHALRRRPSRAIHQVG